MNARFRLTFSEIVEAARNPAAERVWERARQASEIRRFAARAGLRSSARQAARIKVDAIRLASRLAPERVRVGVDQYVHIGFISVRFYGHGALHLPPGTDMGPGRHAPASVS